MAGWVKLHRRLLESDLWLEEKFTRGQAWVDLIGLANHKDGHIRKRGIKVKVKRGRVGWSEVSLAERWGWSRGKVRRFLKELKMEQQIERETVQQNKFVTSLINIINYDYYQGDGTANGTADRTANGQQTDSKRYRNKNEKNEKNEKKERIYSDKSVEIYSLCENFIEYVNKNFPKLAPRGTSVLQNSAETIDKLVRIDGFDIEYISGVLQWATRDDFWQDNLYSLSGLRKKNGSDNRTKFQKIAASYEKNKKGRSQKPGRLEKNAMACYEFINEGV